MKMLGLMAKGGFEQVIALHDPSCGLAGFVVIHDTARGPAAGGIRLYPYQDEEEALADGFRLARAMTFKAAASDLPVGGGKIVLIENLDLVRRETLTAVGRVLQSLGGRFYAGRDVGVTIEQGAWVRAETDYMVDESDSGVGDLNRATALGVEAGALAAVRFRLGTDSFKGIRIAIQGAGGVGRWLAKMFAADGAELVVSDVEEQALEDLAREIDIIAVGPDDIYAAARDVFCPCAVGGVLNETTIDHLSARVVAGSANNVLAGPEIGQILHERGVTYAPDYLVNAGALIQGIRFLTTGEHESPDEISRIEERTYRLLEQSSKSNEPPEALLERQTLERMEQQRTWRKWAWPPSRETTPREDA
jgi:leucine dehydrogenase